MSEDLFTVQESAEIGRYAVASQPLKAGALIFAELPFAYGPKPDTPPLCLGCLSPADCTTLCTSCSWPVCNRTCENLPIHRNNECAVFTASNSKFFLCENIAQTVSLQYECITPLRMLLAKEANPQRWLSEIAVMESHDSIRRKLPIWRFNQVNIVDYLRGPVKLARFSSELIHRVCGVLEVNAFEARTASGQLIRCLYPKLAILSHNCVSNITHSIESAVGFRVQVRTSVDVGEKSELCSSYTYSLWPTLVRREFLKKSKFFECKCERCSDAAELGSHLGSLKCRKCKNGVVLSCNPLSESCEWNCTLCDFKTSSEEVRKVYAEVQAQIDAVQSARDAEKVFKELGEVLHPKNAYLTELRSVLVQLCGSDEEQRKVELCREVLEVLDVVEPGLTRIRGITLYELHAPLMGLARNRYNSGVIGRDEFRGKMAEAVEVLGKSAEILVFEPEESAEGRLGRAAKAAHEKLAANFENSALN